MKDSYYIFGIQRSGTNYVETLLARNFELQKANPKTKSWKHSLDIPPKTRYNVPIFVIHKNPYTWVESIVFRNTVDWLKTQKKYPADEKGNFMIGEKKLLNLTNIAKSYAHFYNTWLNVPKEYSAKVIRYEDLLLEDSRNIMLSEIRNQFKLKRKPDTKDGWFNPRPGTVSQSKDYDAERQKYYMSMQPSKLSYDEIQEINRVIGPDMFKMMNYEML